jgi:hypothetical protein
MAILAATEFICEGLVHNVSLLSCSTILYFINSVGGWDRNYSVLTRGGRKRELGTEEQLDHSWPPNFGSRLSHD